MDDDEGVPEPLAAELGPADDEELLWSALSNRRRRAVVELMDALDISEDNPISISDLSRQIAASEMDVPVSEVETQARKRVYVSLYQSHLPKMRDAGIVDYDEYASNPITPGPRAEVAKALVRGGAVPEPRTVPRWAAAALVTETALLIALGVWVLL